MSVSLQSADIQKLLAILPHRYPFLLIDKIIDIDGDNSATGIKNVTINEPHFQGHFPGQPIMPGVLIIEAMAQTAGAISIMANGFDTPSIVYFMTIDNAKFRKPVVPGDRSEIRVTKIKRRGNLSKYACVASVDGAKVAEAEVTAMIVNEAAAKGESESAIVSISASARNPSDCDYRKWRNDWRQCLDWTVLPYRADCHDWREQPSDEPRCHGRRDQSGRGRDRLSPRHHWRGAAKCQAQGYCRPGWLSVKIA